MRFLYTVLTLPRNVIATSILLAVDFESLLLRGLACRRLWLQVGLNFAIGERLCQSFTRLRLLTLLLLALGWLTGALLGMAGALPAERLLLAKLLPPLRDD